MQTISCKSPVYTQSIKFDRIELVVSETNVRTDRHRLHIMHFRFRDCILCPDLPGETTNLISVKRQFTVRSMRLFY